MPPKPMPTFIMIKPKLLFHFPVVEFDTPSHFRNSYDLKNVHAFGSEPSQPVFGRGLLSLGPFYQEQFGNSFSMPWLVPPMSSPYSHQCKPRFLRPLGTLSPFNLMPKILGQPHCHGGQIIGLRQRCQRMIFSGPSSPLRRRRYVIGIFLPHHRGGLYLHGIKKTVTTQLLPKMKIITIMGIRNNRPCRQLPIDRLIYKLQGQFRFCLECSFGRNFGFGRPVRIFKPSFWNIQFPTDRAAELIAAPVKGYSNLAIGDLTQSPAILPSYTHGVFARFWERSFVNNPGLGSGEKINDFLGQAALDIMDRPGTLSNKLTQSLDICTRDSFRNRFDGFSVSIQQQPLQVYSRPMPSLTPAHWFKKLPEEQAQPSVQRFQLLFFHESTVDQ